MHQSDRSYYIQMWEDQYDYIPTREPIIVLELACVPEYMPWFRIHGKPYLLSARRDDDAGLSTRPKQSPGPSSAPIQSPGPATATAPTQSPDPAVQLTIPTAQPFQIMPVDRRCIGQSRMRDRKRGRRGALIFTNLHHRMGFKQLHRW
ncbi:hypothetical protein Gotur_005148 [Gossypium turneri]